MKKVFLITFFIVLVITISKFDLRACVYANDVTSPFPPDCKGNIEGYIIEGAKAFFKAKESISSLLFEVESGCEGNFNYIAVLSFTNNAIAYLNKSKAHYLEAYNLGKNKVYLKSESNLLKNFDYDKFAAENNLIIPIMNRVKFYLSNGDVTGYYMQIVNDIEDIANILSITRNYLENSTSPDINYYWKILQKLSEATLFGNYGTMVGKEAFKEQI
jgi:hypothetical protein